MSTPSDACATLTIATKSAAGKKEALPAIPGRIPGPPASLMVTGPVARLPKAKPKRAAKTSRHTFPPSNFRADDIDLPAYDANQRSGQAGRARLREFPHDTQESVFADQSDRFHPVAR